MFKNGLSRAKIQFLEKIDLIDRSMVRFYGVVNAISPGIRKVALWAYKVAC